jgi:hypothetical protein
MSLTKNISNMGISRLVVNVSAFNSATYVWFSEWRGLCRRRHLIGYEGAVSKVSRDINRRARFNYRKLKNQFDGE